MTEDYDAIVVGARCAGSPTAMLLARKGYRVLLVDRASFPSDTVSTHLIHAPGVAALDRWGLLDDVVASGCPPVETYSYDFGPFTIRGTAHPADGHTAGYGPRRTVLDTSWWRERVPPASRCGNGSPSRTWSSRMARWSASGATVRDGATVTERGRVVIGADGRNSASPRLWLSRRITPSRSCSGASTPTGATSPSTAWRSSSAPTGAGPRHRPTTA